MLRIGLVGDRKANLCHIGDEASLNEVTRRIASDLPTATSIEYEGSVPRPNASLALLHRLNSATNIPASLRRWLERIDLIWLVGAGNLTSLFASYLYHRLVIIRSAGLLRLPVVATSQTIGPFTEDDRRLFAQHVQTVRYWSVRDAQWSAEELKSCGAACQVAPDDALVLPYKVPKVEGDIKVGLSLRDRDDARIDGAVKEMLAAIGKRANVFHIPHLFTRSGGYDADAMARKFPGQPFHLNVDGRSDIAVKSLTAAMDLVITTRYHGAVFSATTNVPCVALFIDGYYERKLRGLAAWGYTALVVSDALAVGSHAATDVLERRAIAPMIRLTSVSEVVSARTVMT